MPYLRVYPIVIPIAHRIQSEICCALSSCLFMNPAEEVRLLISHYSSIEADDHRLPRSGGGFSQPEMYQPKRMDLHELFTR